MTNENMFHKLFLSSKEGLNRLVARIVPPSDIEDIVQETYVRLCGVKDVKGISSPKSFMYKTAKNLALDYAKQARVKLVDDVDDWNAFESLLTDTTHDEEFQKYTSNKDFEELCEAIRMLPVQCRKVFVLKKVYGHSQKEIASSLGLSESTVEKHVSAGTKRCYQFIKNQRSLEEKSFVKTKQGDAK
ncbi:RNA polymerase sigma factor [Thalassotalea euphylliae]|uniref:RNA polymerase sigma factor n=1 Tax=Thalassotalea euphylliae TaxID=1655234 RepID=A0A3E0TUZ5_9GAMM|nr:RNA polymerase sigma factor [Thalassotalea euphylliae]REL28274.1 RNA polymerase sigma factor [Thalassotalea euphylliae]